MDAAVVGVPHRTLGEEPAAVVHLRPGGRVNESELREFARARLAPFKVPVRILIWPQMLPRNSGGKIVKAKLKDYFAGELANAN
jgi:long-chain acyl-CoA synthetase